MCNLTFFLFSDCVVFIVRREQLEMTHINLPRQLAKPKNRNWKRVLQAGAEKRRAREGERVRRDWDKMLALRVRWREWEREKDTERQICELPRPLTLYRGPLWDPVTACLNTQTPNSSEVCGQDGSELQLQGKASFRWQRRFLIHTHARAHAHTDAHTHTSHTCILCANTPIFQRETRENWAAITWNEDR